MKHEVWLPGAAYPAKVFDEGREAAEWLKSCVMPKGTRIIPRRENAIERLKDKAFLEVPGLLNNHCRIREDAPNVVFVPEKELIKEVPFKEWIKDYTLSLNNLVDDCDVIWHGCKIEFARTEEEIIWVYKHGPPSCTTADAGERGLDKKNKHPLAVIGNSEIQVAYVKGSDPNKVVWRTLISEDRKLHDYGYTNGAQRLGETAPRKLRAMGFKKSACASDWKGARVNKIPLVEEPKRFLIPALDIIYNLNYKVADAGDHFLLGTKQGMKSYECSTGDGFAYSKNQE